VLIVMEAVLKCERKRLRKRERMPQRAANFSAVLRFAQFAGAKRRSEELERRPKSTLVPKTRFASSEMFFLCSSFIAAQRTDAV
jgi:hypothetical protein